MLVTQSMFEWFGVIVEMSANLRSAFIMFSMSGLSVGVKAYRDIKAGEEISVSCK
jgi:hypothetical protein